MIRSIASQMSESAGSPVSWESASSMIGSFSVLAASNSAPALYAALSRVGAEGVLGILPRHAPLLTTLLPGIVRIKRGGAEEAMAVGGGFLQVARDQVR